MFKPKIDKASVIHLKDSQLTFGKENRTTRWWVRYEGLEQPVWCSAEQKQLLGLIVQLTTLNGLRSLRRSVSPHERYRKEICGGLDSEIKSCTRAINRTVSITDNRMDHKVKFIFDSTENITTLDGWAA